LTDENRWKRNDRLVPSPEEREVGMRVGEPMTVSLPNLLTTFLSMERTETNQRKILLLIIL